MPTFSSSSSSSSGTPSPTSVSATTATNPSGAVVHPTTSSPPSSATSARPAANSFPLVLKFEEVVYKVKLGKPTAGWCDKLSAFGGGDGTSKNKKATASAAGSSSSRAREKTIVSGMSGVVRPGEMLAMLGPSGSGKTTLLTALGGRHGGRAVLSGKITYNGQPFSGAVKRRTGFVTQHDVLYPHLTVSETLWYTAALRLPRSLSAGEKRAQAEAVARELGLGKVAGSMVGGVRGVRGLSGGERKRVSIGLEMLVDPSLLLLDEPTSGLDSTSAFMVVKVLQRIAQSGSVVVMSIHQPSYRILGLLDRLLFLSRGQTVYYGTPRALPSFFNDFGKPIPGNENPTEFALDLIRELETMPDGARDLVEHNKKWQTRMAPKAKHHDGHGEKPSLPLKEAISASISRGKLVSGASDGSVSVHSPGELAAPAAPVSKFANPFWVEMGVLTRRAFLSTKRTPEIFIIRLAAVMVTGFILATIFWRLDDSPKGVEERLGFFAIAMSTMFYTCSDSLPVFLNERYIFLRETAYNAYRRSSYVLSHTIVGFPSLIVLSFAFALTTFFAVGLAGGADGFFFFVAIVLASFWAGSGFATFLSGVVTNVMLGFPVVVSTLAYFLLFSGFFINRDRIPKYWLWFHYLSLVKYPYEAVMQNEFSDPTRCFVRGVQMFDNTPLAALPGVLKVRVLRAMSQSLGVDIGTNTCITTGPDFLRQQAVTDLTKWDCLWITVAWGFLFRVLFYISLLLGSRNKRR